MREFYFLESENIFGDEYIQFIDLLGVNSDFFTMNKHYDNNGNVLLLGSLFKALSPFCTDTLPVNDWYCNYDMSSYYVDNVVECRIEVQAYPSNSTTLDILKSNCNNIYLYGKETIPLGEDLCFFKNGELFMGTVSHERMCGIYPLTKNMSKKLQRYGKWNKVDYSIDSDINRIKYSPRLC